VTDKVAEAIARGHRAEALLDDPLLIETFDTLEKTYQAAWRDTKVAETEKREWLFVAINLLGKVRDHIKEVARNGRIEQATLNMNKDTQ